MEKLGLGKKTDSITALFGIPVNNHRLRFILPKTIKVQEKKVDMQPIAEMMHIKLVSWFGASNLYDAFSSYNNGKKVLRDDIFILEVLFNSDKQSDLNSLKAFIEQIKHIRATYNQEIAIVEIDNSEYHIR